MPSICFEAEQLILRGPAAAAALPDLLRLLNKTRDPSDVFSKLRPMVRPTVLVDPPAGAAYEYLPLATGAKRVPKKLRERFLRKQTPAAVSPEAYSAETAVAFFTSWSNSFTEIFSRAVIRLFSLWCALIASGTTTRETLHLMPAMWGSSWGPDYARYWLKPFSGLPVEPMAATPQRELVKTIWRAQASPSQFARYANLSSAMFAARTGPRCYKRALVCDFTGMPWGHELNPWSAVQMIAAHHGGASQAANTRRVHVPRMRACSPRDRRRAAAERDASSAASGAAAASLASGALPAAVATSAAEASASAPSESCALNIVFADRKGRRKLANILQLVDQCNQWVPPPPLRAVNCSAHNFGVGLINSLPVLWRADVLVVSHGADVINGFGMHAGASIVEVMPVHQAGCPCDMYRRMYTYQGPAVFHYQLVSKNASREVPRPGGDRSKMGTYHSDLFVPWEAVVNALEHVVATGARRAKYAFKRFPF